MEHIRIVDPTHRHDVPSAGSSAIYACRHCRDAVKVAAIRYLPEACPGCRASTWDGDGRCGNWERCDARRRQGIRGRSHCHACGHSIWVLVGIEESSRILAGIRR